MTGLGRVWVASDGESDKLNRDLSGYSTRHGNEDKGSFGVSFVKLGLEDDFQR